MYVVNMPRLINLDLRPLQTSVPWVRRLKDLPELLKRLSSSLDKEEEDERDLNANPHNIHKVKFPANLLDSNGDTVGVDHHGDVEEEEVETGTLGTSTVLETLDSVEGLEGSPAPGEEDAEEVDGYDGAIGEVVVRGGGGGKGSEENVGEETAPETAHEHLSSTELVKECGTVDGGQHTENRVDGVDEKLLVGVLYEVSIQLTRILYNRNLPVIPAFLTMAGMK